MWLTLPWVQASSWISTVVTSHAAQQRRDPFGRLVDAPPPSFGPGTGSRKYEFRVARFLRHGAAGLRSSDPARVSPRRSASVNRQLGGKPFYTSYPARRAATTRLGAGLTMGCPSITTVGTVSLPSATDRTKAAASGSAQMLTWWTERRCHRKTRRSRRQNTQPGRQYTVTLGSTRDDSAGPLTGTSQPRSTASPDGHQVEFLVDGHSCSP